jgi:hypothetical protein
MLKVRRRLGFVAEALKVAWVESGGEGEHLEGHAATQGDLDRLVDDAHAAAADLADKPEIAQDAGLVWD